MKFSGYNSFIRYDVEILKDGRASLATVDRRNESQLSHIVLSDLVAVQRKIGSIKLVRQIDKVNE